MFVTSKKRFQKPEILTMVIEIIQGNKRTYVTYCALKY
jgi:hypothetical protein